jgi:sugar diacid utilization regulator
MVHDLQIDRLRPCVAALRTLGVVPDVAAPLRTTRDAAAETLLSAVVEEAPAYSESGNPEILPELRAHLAEHLDELIRLLGGGRCGDLAFVREHARRRASQRFPLEALLLGHRSLHRVLSAWIRDAALASASSAAHVRRVVAASADFAATYADAVTTIATASYVEHTRTLAEAEGDRRTELLDLLFSGYDESDSRAAQLLRRAGYLEQRRSYCVIAARSVDLKEMDNPARARRMADSVRDALAGTPLHMLVGIRDNLVLAVISGMRRLSGWTAPQSLLADRVYPRLRQIGPAALIGLSNDVPSTSHIPRATIEAKLALDFATVVDRVMPYSRIPLRQVLVTQARDTIQFALPGWLNDYLAADRKARGTLTETLRAYAAADMNVQRAAKSLAVHANTVYTRVQRIADITGLNPLSFHGLTELLLAVDCRG